MATNDAPLPQVAALHYSLGRFRGGGGSRFGRLEPTSLPLSGRRHGFFGSLPAASWRRNRSIERLPLS